MALRWHHARWRSQFPWRQAYATRGRTEIYAVLYHRANITFRFRDECLARDDDDAVMHGWIGGLWANRIEEDCRRTTNGHRFCAPNETNIWHTRVLKCRFPGAVSLRSGLRIRRANGTDTWVVPLRPAESRVSLQVCSSRASMPTSWMRTWIEHHAALGARRVALYDDAMRQLPSRSILGATSGLDVSFSSLEAQRRVPSWYHQQVLAYHDCFARARAANVTWTLFVDMDEFVIAPANFYRLFRSASTKAVSLPVRTLRANGDSCDFHPHTRRDNAWCSHYTQFGNRKYMLSTNVGSPERIHRMMRRECRVRGRDTDIYLLHARWGVANGAPACLAHLRRRVAASAPPRIPLCGDRSCLANR